jgi:hypothetical protein
MQEHQGQNYNYKYILTVIDVLLKYAWAVPLKDKSAKSIIDSFKVILQNNGKQFFLEQIEEKNLLINILKDF